MILALPYPEISPEVFSFQIGGMTLALRWYALAYIAALLIGLWIAKAAIARPRLWPADTPPMTRDQAEALLTWVIIGVILGGRIGFVLFYQPGYYMANPGQILQVWQGGMAFHGGLLGVAIAASLFVWYHRMAPLHVADMIALGTPTGLFLGRIANFINAELWGRPTDVPWGMVFPGPAAQDCPVDWTGPCTRHPSQLYEAALEGLLLAAILFAMAFRGGALRHPGRISGVFFLGYGLARFVVEFARQADAQFITTANPMGYALQIGPLGLTMGQILSLPMIGVGIALIAWSARRRVV